MQWCTHRSRSPKRRGKLRSAMFQGRAQLFRPQTCQHRKRNEKRRRRAQLRPTFCWRVNWLPTWKADHSLGTQMSRSFPKNLALRARSSQTEEKRSWSGLKVYPSRTEWIRLQLPTQSSSNQLLTPTRNMCVTMVLSAFSQLKKKSSLMLPSTRRQAKVVDSRLTRTWRYWSEFVCRTISIVPTMSTIATLPPAASFRLKF